MEGLGVLFCCHQPEILNLLGALHFYLILGLVNYVARAIPRPRQKLQQQDSCSCAPTGVGRHTCYSRVTFQDWLLSWLGTAEHPFPLPPLSGLPRHSVPSCHSFLAHSSVKATAWQRDRGGSSSVSYRIPFLPPPPSLPSFPGLEVGV